MDPAQERAIHGKREKAATGTISRVDPLSRLTRDDFNIDLMVTNLYYRILVLGENNDALAIY